MRFKAQTFEIELEVVFVCSCIKSKMSHPFKYFYYIFIWNIHGHGANQSQLFMPLPNREILYFFKLLVTLLFIIKKKVLFSIYLVKLKDMMEK